MTIGSSGLDRLRIALLTMALAWIPLEGPAHAATFNLAGEAVAFQPPAGYCFLDRSDGRERPLFDRMERLQQASGNQLVTIFALCDELSKVSNGQTPSPAHYGMLVAVLQNGAVKTIPDATRFDLFKELHRSLDSDRMQNAVSQASDALKQEGITNTQLSPLAFAGEDQFGFYSASTIILDMDHPASNLEGVYATTLVKQIAFATYLYAPLQEPQAKETLLAIQHSLLADFIGLNESAEEQDRQARTGQSFLGIDWRQVLIKGAIGACVAGVIAWLRIAIRKRRRKTG